MKHWLSGKFEVQRGATRDRDFVGSRLRPNTVDARSYYIGPDKGYSRPP